MADKPGGYLRPCISNNVTADYNNHRYGRTPPSSEPGTDYGVAYGSSIRAAEDGIVAYVDHSPSGAEGRRIAVKHPDGQMTSDIHLSRILVNSGQKVKRGQEIAKSGASAWGKEWGVGAHVHRTLFPTHNLTFGTTRTLDFQKQEGPDNDGGGAGYSQTVANQQSFMNIAQGEKLVIDGRRGPATIAAIKRYQQYLTGRKWYSGKIDGDWGAGTQAGHAKRYAEWSKPHAPETPKSHIATVDDLASLPHLGGLQKLAHLYGYTQKNWLDFTWGPGTRNGLQKFLNQNYGGSLANWLRSKHGYVGNDQWGPVMKAAAMRAENANWRAL